MMTMFSDRFWIDRPRKPQIGWCGETTGESCGMPYTVTDTTQTYKATYTVPCFKPAGHPGPCGPVITQAA